MLLCLVSFRHGFRRARTLGFRTEIVADSFISGQKLICEHVDHSKSCRAWSPLFCYGMVAEPFGFKEKLCLKHVISVQNRRMRRQFQSETEGPDAMGLSQTSQRRDFGKVDDFEPLSL